MGESRMISLFKEREYIMFYCLNCQLHKVSKSFFLYANLVQWGNYCIVYFLFMTKFCSGRFTINSQLQFLVNTESFDIDCP